ncbi:hypothetical protein [Flavisolibacter ginsenosidimutans]|uniref:Uncharacterized protein n=1 Tax=Flavisolibacter ginsenosidimutans TaxID=661481 RepID=A0A5B8UPM5_9BACT|nr:hypothetical protein [Flavisolibacter ginsenosidimutans]QEC58000.1 hypothetical protein FSB75_19500 [Flavisolibacter ginsenosidimutans]
MENDIENEKHESLLNEYRSFEEFKAMNNEQILEIDQFLRLYAEVVYNCFGRLQQKAKVIHIDHDQVSLSAA